MGEVYPWTYKYGACRQWYALVAQRHEQAQHHATTRRVAGKNDGVGVVLLREQVEVHGQTVLQATREWKLGREPVLGRYDSGLELAGMALHLVAVLVDATEEVGAAVHIQHDPVAFGYAQLLPRFVVLAHLDPLGLEGCAFPSPLPPRLPAHRFHAPGTQLLADVFGGSQRLAGGYVDHLHVHPARYWHPLRRKGLQLVYSVERRVVKEAADELEALVIGNVCGRLLLQRPAVEVVRDVRLDDDGGDGSAHGDGVDRHDGEAVEESGVRDLRIQRR